MDFKELRRKHARPDPIDPEEIFRRKPKPPGIDDLYSSQAEVLRHWFKHRTQRDTVIKLHTGGGKTLVGLLIGQSVINEIHEPVLYLVPNLQLVDQVLAKAHAYSIPAVQYERGEGLPDVFLNGNSILVCTYAALFNGKSRFGVRGGNRPITKVACVIVDDAHVGALDIRDRFTLKLERSKDPELYEELTHTFRRDFEQIDKLGTFDDVVEGADYNILEVPYWSWSAKQQAVREMLRHSDELVWPFIRDMLDYCHAFITSSAFVVTPLLPPTDMIPTFAECPRRVFMSATIRDDSAVVRAFEVDFTSIQAPLTSKSLAGVSERMILAPDLMSLKGDLSSMVRGMVQRMSQSLSVVVLVPSAKLAGNWEQLGSYLDSSERVQSAVAELQKGQSRGVYIFANRYDGIDLPGDACRLLVVDGLPQGMNVYDAFRANVLSGGTAVNTIQAQRIEQGIGRAGRGVGDYCVVLITGKDLVAWISQTANQRLLTTATRAQVDMGLEVTKHVVSEQDLWDTVQRCMTRDQDWIEYHAEALADGTEAEDHLGTLVDLKTATLERQVFRLLRDGHHDKAIRLINTFCAPSEGAVLPDRQTVGWVKQLAARVAYDWGHQQTAEEFQREAYAANHNLLRPVSRIPYMPISTPGKQAKTVADNIDRHRPRKGYMAKFEEAASFLVSTSSSNQFEQALSDLGGALGFATERPDHLYGKGPDVLWLMPNNVGWVVEAKSRKQDDGVYKKGDHGQLLSAIEWFKENYPGWDYVAVSVHPTAKASKSITLGGVKALTLTNLSRLISSVRSVLTDLCESTLLEGNLESLCEQLFRASSLDPQGLQAYLVPFAKMD